jgi:hypothetical protein
MLQQFLKNTDTFSHVWHCVHFMILGEFKELFEKGMSNSEEHERWDH